MSLDLATITLREAIAGLDTREFSVFELTRETLLRARGTEPDLHAYVEVFEELALKTSLSMDRSRQAQLKLRPLTGIPIAIKDIADIAGVRTRCGSKLREQVPVAVRDAEVVHRLRRDGANFIGKTTTQEFAAGVVSAPCRNPWDLDRIPGGSSGGSAASVAMGTSLGALGTDTGGSIRIPASVTGTVGLKPTWGRLPLNGIYPLAPSLDTAGPIARAVGDALLLYLVMANRKAEIPGMDEMLAPSGRKGLDGVRLGIPTSFFTERVQPDVQAAYEAALGIMRNLGAEVIEVAWADAASARALGLIINRVETSAVHHDHIRGADADLLGRDLRLRAEAGSLLPADLHLRATIAREKVRDSMATVFVRHKLDAIVTPTTPGVAPRADRLVVDYEDGSEEGVGFALTRLTMPFNATGQPVISVPCGFDGDEMPIGLSIAGRPDDEIGICRIAHQYEQATRWFRAFATPEPAL
ncbi:MAG TPA: amidase [Thermomicrobiales bacterium]|nr:amidase [Thermomicrobiales bacterium]